MQTYKPLHIIAILAFIIAVMACASRRTASDDLRSTATTAADVMATQTHAAVRTDTATTQSATTDTMRQQTATTDTIGAHYRRATWQQADTSFTEVWINARRFRYHDAATAATSSRQEARAATSSAIDTDSCRLISHTDTVSIAQKKHIETDRRPLDDPILVCIASTIFILLGILCGYLCLLHIRDMLKK